MLKLNELIISDNPQTGQILSEIHGGIHQIISSFYDVAHVHSVKEEPNMFESSSVKQLKEENKKLASVIQNMQAEMKRLDDSKAHQKGRLENEKAELQDQIKNLETENKKYLETIIKHSKGEMNSVGQSISSRSSRAGEVSNKPPAYAYDIRDRGFNKSPPKIPKTKEFTYSKYGSSKGTRGVSSNSGNKPGYKGTNLTGSIGQTQVRNLSLKQLKDIINDIYVQKVKYDQK